MQKKHKDNFLVLVLVVMVLTRQFNIVTPEPNCLGLNPNSNHIPMWLQAPYLTSLCLSVPICTMGMLIDPMALGCERAKFRANICKLTRTMTNTWWAVSHIYYCYCYWWFHHALWNWCCKARCEGMHRVCFSWSSASLSRVIVLPFLSSLLPREPPEDASCVREERQEKHHVKDCLFPLFFLPFFEVGLALLSHRTKALPYRKDLSVFRVSSAFKGVICFWCVCRALPGEGFVDNVQRPPVLIGDITVL